MEGVIATYDLHKNIQTREFGCDLLLGKATPVDYHGDPQQWDPSRLAELGFGKDGDRQLLIAVLKFSQMLLAACGNRSIYMSSAHLDDLLNSTYYEVVIASLEVGQELAQRYQASVKRMGPTPARAMSQALLANHYNIDLEKVQVLAQPFVKTPLVKFSEPTPATPASAHKGKEKAHFGGPKNVAPMYANDLKFIVAPNQDTAQRSWNGWGDIKIVYHPKSLPRTDAPENNDSTPGRTGSSSTPATPTPLRRSTTMPGIQTPRAGRQNGGDDSSPAQPRTPATAGHEETASVSHKALEVPQSTVATTSIYELLARCPPDMPFKSRYEYLHRLRVAKALLGTPEDRQKALSIRLLAINNLAYIHPEKEFLEKVLKHDDDEPRRTQLVYQLADLIHPAGEGEREVPLSLQSIAFNLLEIISHTNAKHNDVLSALNANVNHGVLLYVVRKAVEKMSKDEVYEDKEKEMDTDEWITSLLALAFHLALTSRLGPEIVAAGLMDSLIEIIKLRTPMALRYHSTVFSFLDNLVAGMQGGFQSFNSPGGLEAVADLLVYTVSRSREMVDAGQGNPPEVHTSVVDYDVPFYQQQTLKWGLKFIHRIMSHFSFGANTDRVLRNMVDNSALLRALRSIIENKQVFGTVVWTAAVTLLSDFLNNDPTSFAAIQESGMIKGFLEALTGRQVTVDVPAVRPTPQREEGTGDGDGDEDAGEPSSPPESTFGSPDLENDERPHPPTQDILEAPREVPIARGILPSAEAICIVPTILNSICLNNAGMKMVVQSRALDTLMEIFESPEHVRLIDSTDGDCFHTLGTSIDELARHHPALRKNIGDAIVDMMARVVHLAYQKAATDGWGAKLLVKDTEGNVVTADQRLLRSSEAPSRKGKEKAVSNDSDVEMVDASEDTADSGASSTSSSATSEGAILPHISALYIFLEAVQPNASLKTHVIKAGGIELLLKLMEAPSLPSSCVDSRAMRGLSQTAAQFIDAKPIIGVPSLLRRLQKVLDTLEPLAKDDAHRPFFAWFLLPDELFNEAREHFPDFDKKLADGTRLVKALVHAQVYMRTLHGCFPYHRGATYTFPNVNVYDYYTRFIKTLGPLLHSILKEEITLSNKVPSHWAKGKTFGPFRALGQMPDILPDTRPESTLTPEASATDLAAAVAGVAVPSVSVAHGTGTDTPKADEATKPQTKSKEKPTAEEQTSPQFLNYKALTTLLTNFPNSSYPVLQVIGKALFSRKDRDAYLRYRHTQIAESLADMIVLSGIDKEAPDSHFHYWLVVLKAIEGILIDENRHSERQSGQLVHIVLPALVAFKEKGGLEMLNTMLERFADAMLEDQAKDDDGSNPNAKLAAMGMKKILDIYAMLVHGRNITELNSLLNAVPPRPGSSSSDRRPELGQIGSQIVVELRMSILPVVRKLWDSKIVEKCSTPVLSKIIDILKTICAAEQENSAYRRSDTSARALIFKQDPVRFNWSQPALDLARVAADDDDDLVKEAVYRTFGKAEDAVSYCEYHKKGLAGERNPIPPEDAYQSPAPSLSRASGAPSPPATLADAMNLDPALGIERLIGNVIGGVLGGAGAGAGAGAAADDDSSEGSDTSSSPRQVQFNDPHPAPDASVPTSAATSQQAAGSSSAPVQTSNGRPRVVTEDLDEARSALRSDLIDRCLDVLQVHPDSVFEVSELIQAAILRSETEEKRREVGEVLANALMSFASEDDKAAVGQSIAAYAHLLSLLLQDKLFYKATLPALKENISAYLGFLVPSMPSSTGNDSDKTVSVPWMPYILLIFEIMLAEDELPVEMRWKAPMKEDESIEEPVLVEREANLQAEERTELVQNVLALLPHIGKDEALATSALRILAIVTRQREIAKEVGSRKQLQRLFVMAKQLCGAESGRLRESRVTKSLLIILRHVIEDEDTIRQIMRTEIKTFMDNATRNPRTPDLGSYLRHLAHVALRNPQIFIEVTSDMVKFSRFPPLSGEAASRQGPSPLLVLKESAQPRPTVASNDVSVEPAVQGTEDLTINDVKPSTEAGDKEMTDVPKTPAVEMKPPVLENPDGVVHFILCELLNYREVEDKEVVSPPTIAKDKDSKHEGETAPVATLTAMLAATPAAEGASPLSEPSAGKENKTSTPKFRAEEHPIYVYRCFLLSCLTELLQSYSRAKVEFINFKRSAPIQAATPVKPRSSVLNYLLHDLLCQNNLTVTPDTVALKKKAATSAAAQQVLVALMAKTGEKPVDRRASLYEYDDEADLLFVRRFVLDTILKAYKGTTASAEPFEIRYAKMLSLADLMAQMIGGGDKDLSNPRGTDPSAAQSQAQIKRLMFEKGYLPALTASISEIDLTFPDVKRTIKYILRVLKSLTKTAISLSHANLITDTQADTIEDEIASASSLSDMDDDREETPDLYRNSTLGMLEPGGGEDDYSEDEEDEDEEMYDDEYGDEMDYGEEISEDNEEDVSDEDDEEIGGMGPIEGLSGDILPDFDFDDHHMHEMEDDDMDEDDEDMDEDDDDEDGEEEDDDDEVGSEDLEELEDRVEIIDEEGNPVDDDGQSGWEDDTDDDDDEGDEDEEEIDYDAEVDDFGEPGDENGLRRFGHIMRAMGDPDHNPEDIVYDPYLDDGEDDGMLQPLSALTRDLPPLLTCA
jgi:E3 ubiquitin-protein ligase HUWE1